jgi:hypothetical protein
MRFLEGRAPDIFTQSVQVFARWAVQVPVILHSTGQFNIFLTTSWCGKRRHGFATTGRARRLDNLNGMLFLFVFIADRYFIITYLLANLFKNNGLLM